MSFQPAQVPTVNALVNQSAQGMQNILATERQREADQMVRQDRETANLTRALAPAMAAAFSDPSDAGLDAALSLVPEQYRSNMAAQVSQLRGIRDPNRRKDVMRSALLQDEIGQALLAQLEPTANARLNAEIAATQNALRLREIQQKEKEFARGPAPKFEIRETDIGLVRVDPQTGEVFPIAAPGAVSGIPSPAPKLSLNRRQPRRSARSSRQRKRCFSLELNLPLNKTKKSAAARLLFGTRSRT